ncbi:hypothetical protein [Actinophytocola algeriensis]|jgi:hypothetical protein|uniref:Uncharacterized protein n=1 Tax=Actinophytocola algeriensis TaxID=1768010 RepID=A0A7W7QAX4_9PSEU|nr:hypothetical protein [Actinophytocola algeriensis]MBB4910224.1 hypothetical protein [Actinophytocola algeriensis]MBE1480787.1 hypothetical protein [Actinophytocola algeriensis]
MTAAESGDHVPFRYALPPTPVAGAAVEIDHVAVTVELRLTGDLDVLTTAPADRTRALAALRTVAKGLMIRGLGSPAPSVSATAGHRFTQRHHDFRTPDTVTFTGDCVIGFTQQSVTVHGEATYALTVTAASAHATDDDTGNARTWFLRHEKELAAIGMVLLIAAPITPGRLSPR